MKKNILLLMALCVLLSSASLFAQNSFPMSQGFMAKDKDHDRDHDKHEHRKHRKHRDRDHDKDRHEHEHDKH